MQEPELQTSTCQGRLLYEDNQEPVSDVYILKGNDENLSIIDLIAGFSNMICEPYDCQSLEEEVVQTYADIIL